MLCVAHTLANLEDHLEADSRWRGETEHAEVSDEPRGDRVAAPTGRGTRSTDDHILCVLYACVHSGESSVKIKETANMIVVYAIYIYTTVGRSTFDIYRRGCIQRI